MPRQGCPSWCDGIGGGRNGRDARTALPSLSCRLQFRPGRDPASGRSAAARASGFDIADQMGNSPEECTRTYVHARSEDARDRVRRAVAEAARKAS
jgi:hypothetical protein